VHVRTNGSGGIAEASHDSVAAAEGQAFREIAAITQERDALLGAACDGGAF